MAAYSLDLRRKIVDAVERGVGTRSEIAALFGVHESFVYKLLRQKRARGDIAPLPHGGGAVPKLNEEDLIVLTDLVTTTPDATLDELREQIRKQLRIDVSVPTVWRALDLLELSRKKKTRLAAEADPEERAEFEQKQPTLPVERLVFLDEFGINLAMSRTHGYAPVGERVEVIEPFNRGQNISTISSMSLTGVGPTMSIEGAVDTQVFDLYVEKFLVPSLLPSDLVLLDNVKFHYSAGAIAMIEAAGASVLHIPTYSPDFNPIEECISKIKQSVRSAKARTKRKLLNALAKALKKVTIDNICGWFAHCGYTFSLA